jgi:uncharacterized repeat protein (TIGR01451 family)
MSERYSHAANFSPIRLSPVRPVRRRLRGGRSSRLLRAVFEALESRQLMSADVVCNLNDSGPGSLRQAVIDANATPNLNNTITFNSSLSGQTITLTGGDLEISSDLSITGLGATNLTISGGGNSTVFAVDSGWNVSISGLTISGGNANGGNGGGIYNNGFLGLNNVNFSGNSGNFGGGIYNDSTLSVNNANFSGDSGLGGGIYNDFNGMMTVTNSCFSGEQATNGDNGGAVYNDGLLASIANSTFSGNQSTTGIGGAIDNDGEDLTISNSTFSGNLSGGAGGGAIYSDGSLSIVNSTFSGNQATFPGNTNAPTPGLGGAIYNDGDLTITNGTISGNAGYGGGGGIYEVDAVGSGVDATLYNTIVAGNTSNSGLGDITGTLDPASSYNLIGTGGYGGLSNSNGNMVDVANTGLGTLGFYGGPTETIPLSSSSPAVDAGSNVLALDANGGELVTDQRGYYRVYNAKGGSNATVDIGAYEYNAPAAPSSLQVVSTSDNVAYTGALTLRQAVGFANFVDGPSTITFAPSFSASSPQTITLSVPSLVPDGSLELNNTSGAETIDGPGEGALSISGNNAYTVFSVATGVTAAISGVTITEGNAENYYGSTDVFYGDGGAIDNSGTVTVSASDFTNNNAFYGGAIDNENRAILAVTGSQFSGNGAYQGGAVYDNYEATINGSTLSDNTANDGGAIYEAGFGSLGNDTLCGNSATGTGTIDGGGAIYNQAFLVVTDSTISGDNNAALGGAIFNTANLTLDDTTVSGVSGSCGALYNDKGTSNVTDCTFTNDASGDEGGGAIDNFAILNAVGTTFCDDSADGGIGGAIANYGVGTITSCTFTNNSANDGGWGGATYSSGDLTVSGSAFDGNTAGQGGALFNQGSISIVDSISTSAFVGNAASEGGAIYNQGSMAVVNSTFAGNTATGGDGGAIYNDETLTVTNSTFAQNEAAGGAAIFADDNGNTTIYNSIVADNTLDDGTTPDEIDGLLDSDLASGQTGSSYNLFGLGSTGLSDQPNQVDNQVGVADVLLAPLANYGGPTETMPPLPGSLAIGNGSPSLAVDASGNTLTGDQRDQPHVPGAAVDIGAVQTEGYSLTAVAVSTGQSAVVQTNFANPLVVTIMADNGLDPVNGGFINLIPPGSGPTASLSNYTPTIVGIGPNGTSAAVTATAGTVVGSYNVTASIDNAQASFGLTNLALPVATYLVFTTEPSNTIAGSIITPPVQVTIEDQFGNVLTSDSSSDVTLSVYTGPGSLNGNVMVQVQDGVATFSNLYIDTAGTYTLQAVDGGLNATSDPFNIAAGTASQLVFTEEPANTQAGSIMPTVQVSVEDQYNNVETGDYDSITLSIPGQPGLLQGMATVNAVAGVATYNDLYIDTAGIYQLLANDQTLNLNATSSQFTITAAPAYKLVYKVQPSDTMAGVIISPAVEVAVEDQFNNILTSDNSIVGLSVSSGPGALNGTLSIQAVNGIATFSNLYIDTTGTYSLLAMDGSLGATSNPFNITVAPTAKIVFSQQPTSTTAGSTIFPAVTVSVEDQYGNVETGDNDNMTLSLVNPPPGVVLNGTLTVTEVQGVATFSNLSIDTVGNYKLGAVEDTLNLNTTSSPFNISAAAASKLVFTEQPVSTSAGNTLAQVQVAVEDQYNNIETSDNAPITLSIPGEPGLLLGTVTVNEVSGVATFNNLVIDTAGTYTLYATDGTLNTTSNPFNITAATASKLVFTTQPSNTAVGNHITPAVTVAVEDTYGNIETSDNSDEITMSLNGTPGVLSGTLMQPVISGVATFPDLSVGAAGTYTLGAADVSLTATSHPFNVTQTINQGPQVDLSITNTVSNPTPNVNTNVTYNVTVTNAGSYSTATNINVSDALPSGEILESDSPGVGTTYSSGTWTIPSLASGASVTLTYVADVDVFAQQNSTATITAVDQTDAGTQLSASVAVNPQEVDLSINNTVSNPTPNLNSNVTYTVTVTNSGNSSTATNISVSDPVPAGEVFVSDPPPAGTTFSAGVWNISSLAPGASLTLVWVANVNVYEPQTSTASITAVDQTDAGTQLSSSVNVNPQEADLSITNTVSNPTPNVNSNVTYTVTVTNSGSFSAATNINVSDPLPSGELLKSDTPAAGTSYGSGTWNIPSLASGASVTLTYVVDVDVFAQQNSTATITAVDQTDAGTQLSASVAVNPQEVDLSVTKTVSNPTPNVGTNVTYLVTVTNANSYSTATNVSVNDLLPTGETLVSATPSVGTYSGGVWSISSLASGSSATLTVCATVTAFKQLTNTATISSAGQTDVGTQLSASVVVNPQEIDLSVTKTVNNSTPAIGSNVTYVVTVTNAATYSTATNVNLTDLLPSVENLVSATPSVGTYNATTGAWCISALGSGSSATLTVVATVTAAAAPSATNTATITSASQTEVGTQLSASATITVAAQVDLNVTNTVADICSSNISCNFNGTSIPSGDCIWFNGVLCPTLPSGCTSATYNFTDCQIDFSAGGCNYAVSVPNSCVTFSTTCTTATTTYNSTTNCWVTTAPCTGISGNTFLDGCSYKVGSGGLPAGISNVTWCGNFSASQANCGVQWQWGAAVYDQNFCATNYNNLGIKPCDDSSASCYKNSDHAGTPENCKGTDSGTGKSWLCSGATGTGGSNCTGSYSGTGSCSSVPSALAQTCEGNSVQYVITVSNAAGYSNATGIVLSDLLPTGISFVSATTSQGTYSSSSGVWSVGTLTSGSTATLTIVAKTTAYGVFIDDAQVTGVNQTDVNPNPQASSTLIVGSSVSGQAWNDTNGDGLLDNGESGISNVTVELVNSKGYVILTTTTDSNGDYSFLGVEPGSYQVEFLAPSGDIFTTPDVGSNSALNSSATSNNNCNNNNNNNCGGYCYGGSNNCGNYSYSYCGHNYSGCYSNSQTCGSGYQYTSACGSCSFEYCDSGYGNNDCWGGGNCYGSQNNNDCNGGNIGTACVTLVCGTTTGNINAGMYVPGSISGEAWQDSNGDGLIDSGERGLNNVTVKLLSSNGSSVLETTNTNNQGDYSFTNLAPGQYVVQFVAPCGDLFTEQNVGTNPAINSAANPSTGKTSGITLAAAENDGTVNAGLYQTSCLSGSVYVDYNNDGQFDSNDVGMYGVTVQLLNGSGQVVQTATTGCNGTYNFSNIAPGVYSIFEPQGQSALAGCLTGKDTAGTVGCSTDGSAAAAGVIGNVTLGSGSNGNNYNFGVSASGQTISAGDTGSIEFWDSSSGQALIDALNGGSNATNLGNWLASNFANLYGRNCGSYNMTSKTNAQVWQIFNTLYNSSNGQTNAQVLACAFNCYATNTTLCGSVAVNYGFNVEAGGCGNKMFNVWTYGQAFGVANNSVLSVTQILQYANAKSSSGNIDCGNSTMQWETADVFTAINQAGDIGTDQT